MSSPRSRSRISEIISGGKLFGRSIARNVLVFVFVVVVVS